MARVTKADIERARKSVNAAQDEYEWHLAYQEYERLVERRIDEAR